MRHGNVGDLSPLTRSKILITGHTGFKGAWLASFLIDQGAEVYGVGLEVNEANSAYCQNAISERIAGESFIDIVDRDAIREEICTIDPQVVMHLAAQPLVADSYEDPSSTFLTNVQGLVNVLDAALSSRSLKAFLNVTSDKCYENIHQIWGYREHDALGGYDPYSASKACAELVTKSYLRSFFSGRGIGLATARAGNVIGGGDVSHNRLLPDIIRAGLEGGEVQLRNPGATRPWQHVLETVYAYSTLGAKLVEQPDNFSGPWNFGPRFTDMITVREVVDAALTLLGNATAEELADPPFHEAGLLFLDTTKSARQLGVSPNWDVYSAIRETVEWEKFVYEGGRGLDITRAQVDKYREQLSQNR